MSGRFFFNLDRNRPTAVFQQGVNEILAYAMEFDTDLVVERLGSCFVEVEEQFAAAELKRLTLLN